MSCESPTTFRAQATGKLPWRRKAYLREWDVHHQRSNEPPGPRAQSCRSRHSHHGYQFGLCNNGSWPHGFPGEGQESLGRDGSGSPLRSLRGPSPWRSAQLRLRNYSLAQRKIQTSGIAFPIHKLAFCPPGRCLPRTYRRAGLNRETGPSWPRAGKETCQNRSGILLVSYIRNPLRGAHLIFQLWTSPLLMRLS